MATFTPLPSCGRGDVAGLAGVEPGCGDLGGLLRRVEPEGGAVVGGQLVGEGVEGEAAGEAEGGDDLGAGDEVHGLGAAVVASREVAVV